MDHPDSTSAPIGATKLSSAARPRSGGLAEGLQVLRILLKELSTKKDAVRNVRQFFFKKIIPAGYVDEAVQGILEHVHKLKSRSSEKLFRAKLAVVYVVDAILRKDSLNPATASGVQHAFEPHLETLIRLCVESAEQSMDRSLKLRRVVEAWSSQPFVSDAVCAKCLEIAGLAEGASTYSTSKAKAANPVASASDSDENMPFRAPRSSVQASHEVPPHFLQPPPPPPSPPSPPPPPRSRPDRSSQHLKARHIHGTKLQGTTSRLNDLATIQGGPVAAVLELQNERREDSFAGHDQELRKGYSGDTHSGPVGESRIKSLGDEGPRSTASEDPRSRHGQGPRTGSGGSLQHHRNGDSSLVADAISYDQNTAGTASRLSDNLRNMPRENNRSGLGEHPVLRQDGRRDESLEDARSMGPRGGLGDGLRNRRSADSRDRSRESQRNHRGEVPYDGMVECDRRGDDARGSRMVEDPRNRRSEDSRGGGKGESSWDRRGDDARGSRMVEDPRKRRSEDSRGGGKGESSWDRRGDDARGSRMVEDPRKRRSEDSRGGGKGERSWDRRGDDARFGLDGKGFGGCRGDGKGGRFSDEPRDRRGEGLRSSSRRSRSRSRDRRSGPGNFPPADKVHHMDSRYRQDAQNMRDRMPSRDLGRSKVDESRDGNRYGDKFQAPEQSRAGHRGSERIPRGRDELETSRRANEGPKTRDDDEQPSEKRQRVDSTSQPSVEGSAETSTQAGDMPRSQKDCGVDNSEPSVADSCTKTHELQSSALEKESLRGSSCGDENIDFDYSDLDEDDEHILTVIKNA